VTRVRAIGNRSVITGNRQQEDMVHKWQVRQMQIKIGAIAPMIVFKYIVGYVPHEELCVIIAVSVAHDCKSVSSARGNADIL